LLNKKKLRNGKYCQDVKPVIILSEDTVPLETIVPNPVNFKKSNLSPYLSHNLLEDNSKRLNVELVVKNTFQLPSKRPKYKKDKEPIMEKYKRLMKRKVGKKFIRVATSNKTD